MGGALAFVCRSYTYIDNNVLSIDCLGHYVDRYFQDSKNCSFFHRCVKGSRIPARVALAPFSQLEIAPVRILKRSSTQEVVTRMVCDLCQAMKQFGAEIQTNRHTVSSNN